MLRRQDAGFNICKAGWAHQIAKNKAPSTVGCVTAFVVVVLMFAIAADAMLILGEEVVQVIDTAQVNGPVVVHECVSAVVACDDFQSLLERLSP